MAQNQYITIEELAEAYDERALEQLGSDTGTPLTFSDPPVVGDDTEGIIRNAIERASARVERSATIGNKYTVDQLTTLATTDDDWSLKGVVAALAAATLYRRRGNDLPPDLNADYEDAVEVLDALVNGQSVFKLEANQRAGAPSIRIMPRQTRLNRNLVSDQPVFPQRLPDYTV